MRVEVSMSDNKVFIFTKGYVLSVEERVDEDGNVKTDTIVSPKFGCAFSVDLVHPDVGHSYDVATGNDVLNISTIPPYPRKD